MACLDVDNELRALLESFSRVHSLRAMSASQGRCCCLSVCCFLRCSGYCGRLQSFCQWGSWRRHWLDLLASFQGSHDGGKLLLLTNLRYKLEPVCNERKCFPLFHSGCGLVIESLWPLSWEACGGVERVWEHVGATASGAVQALYPHLARLLYASLGCTTNPADS